MAYSQLSNEQAARDFHRGAWAHGTPGFEGMEYLPYSTGGLAGAVMSGIGIDPNKAKALPNGQRYLDMTPQQAQQLTGLYGGGQNNGQYYDPATGRMYLKTPQNSNPYVADALGMGYTLDQLRGLGPAESAQVFDDVIAMRESKNQRPKRTGLLGYALPAMSALVGGPAFGGLVGAGYNAAKGNYLGAAGSLLGGIAFQQNPMGQSLWNQSKIGQSVNNLFSGNKTPSLPGGVPTSGIRNPNAVPGGSTGITTPTGGGIVGSGQLNPAGVGILGNTAGSGINLGWSPLAVAGGATAMPGVTGLPTGGKLPGTNQIIGDAPAGSAPTPGSPGYLKYLDDLMAGMYSGMGLAQPPGSTGNALAGAATSGTGGNVGAGMMAAAGGVNDPGFLGEMSRLLGEQAGIGHKTRPGAYFNALGQIQPRHA